MARPNAFLIKPYFSPNQQLVASFAGNINAYDLNHELYVPERFILGNFKKRGNGLVHFEIFYADSSEELAQYEQKINNGGLEVVRGFSLPESTLEKLAQKGRMYVDARKEVVKLASQLNSNL